MSVTLKNGDEVKVNGKNQLLFSLFPHAQKLIDALKITFITRRHGVFATPHLTQSPVSWNFFRQKALSKAQVTSLHIMTAFASRGTIVRRT
jgi:hypothetical protein